MDEYSIERLSSYIKDFICTDYDFSYIKEQLSKYVLPKIEFIIEKSKFFIFENEYVETAWKDMVSLHYVNTSYQIKKYVARVHFFLNDNIADDSYLGFITLRPINEFIIMLSFVVPNWKVLRFNHTAYIMKYERDVHIDDKLLKIETFPFFMQDGIVSICAHADILMSSMFLNKKYGYKKIRLLEMIDTQNKAFYPVEGLDPSEVVDIFINNRVPIKVITMQIADSDGSLPERLILTYVRSQIPIIIGIDRHVVLIIGYSVNDHGQNEFIIYDDSGAFVQSKNNIPCFVSAKPWSYFENKLKRNNEEFYIIIPEHERIYMQYTDYDKFFLDYIDVNETYLTELLGSKYIRKDLLMDCYNFKLYMNSIKNSLLRNQDRGKIEILVKKSLPHYIWTTELHSQINENKIILFADSTIHKHSANGIFLEDNVFVCKNSNPRK